MHPEAYEFVRTALVALTDHTINSVIDLGSRDANGTPRDLFPAEAHYVGVDIEPGPNVDLVMDAGSPYLPLKFTDDDPMWPKADVVVSTELLEHAKNARDIVHNTIKLLRPGGALILTCAGPGRLPHGQHGDPGLASGEYYANIDPGHLETWLREAGYESWTVDVRENPSDVRCLALAPPKPARYGPPEASVLSAEDLRPREMSFELETQPESPPLPASPPSPAFFADDDDEILLNLSPSTKFVVGFVHDGDTVIQFTEFAWRCGRDNIPMIPQVGMSRVASARNAIVRKFLKTPAKWLFMVDTDHDVPSDSLNKLLASAHPESAPIVGGITMRRTKDGDLEATAYRVVFEEAGIKRLPVVELSAEEGLFEVDATGAACILIHRSVFEKIQAETEGPYHWFQDTQIGDVEFGEDITFCMRAKQAGFPIYVHSGAEFPHIKPHPLTVEMWGKQMIEQGKRDPAVTVEEREGGNQLEYRGGKVISIPSQQPTEQSLIAHYDANPNYYSPLQTWDLPDLLSLVGWEIGDTESVLDLGCGDGRAAKWFRPGNYFGIDYSAERIKKAQADWPDHTFAVGDISGLSERAPSRDYHLVLAIDVLEHLEDPDALLDFAMEILPPQGMVFATVPINHVYHAHLQVWPTVAAAVHALEPTTWDEVPRGDGSLPHYVVMGWDSPLRR